MSWSHGRNGWEYEERWVEVDRNESCWNCNADVKVEGASKSTWIDAQCKNCGEYATYEVHKED